MYAKVPEDLKDPLLKELRQLRLKSAFKHYPALVLIFSTVAALLVFVKGHAIIRLFEEHIQFGISDGKLIVIALGVIVIITAGFLVFFLRQEYRDCECQECLYCPKCNAVDKYDDGCCPICQVPLTEKASFFFTTYKDEQEIIERWGLQPSRED